MTPTRKTLAINDQLFQEGELATSFYVVLEGVVSLFNEVDGRKIEKSRAISNSVVGSLLYSQPKPNEYSARAVTNCEVLEFPYSQIKGNLKAIPGWAQLMLKTFSEQLGSAHKQLKSYQSESTKGLSADDILRGTAGLRLAVGSVEPEEGRLSWDKIREFVMQTFQISSLKVEPLVHAFASANWLKIHEDNGNLTHISDAGTGKISGFEDFIRHYRHSRSHRAVIEMTPLDYIAVSSLCACAEGKADNHKGIATVDLADAIKVAQTMPGGASFKVDYFDTLDARGLDIQKQSSDEGLKVSFNLEELGKIRKYWGILLELGTK